MNVLITLRHGPGYFSLSAVCCVAAKEVVHHGKTQSQRGGKPPKTKGRLVEEQIEGIEMGADAYIPKPFNPRLLKANVRNLLNKSHQMRNLPTANNVRQEIQDKKQREVFGKLVELVNANLTDQQFSVDHLCLELGMNRTKLYSFIKSTTGMSLGNYIRKIRLDKAAELLRTTDMSISEVGYAVGIESPSYFTRTFKEQFGSSPSEFIKH